MDSLVEPFLRLVVVARRPEPRARRRRPPAGTGRRGRLRDPDAARASRRSPASATTVVPSDVKTSVPPTTSASAVIRDPGGNCPWSSARASGFSIEPLDRPPERSGPEGEVRALARDQRPRRRRQLQHEVVLGQPLLQVGQQQVHDRRQLGLGQRVEDDDLVDPVQELRPELHAAAGR